MKLETMVSSAWKFKLTFIIRNCLLYNVDSGDDNCMKHGSSSQEVNGYPKCYRFQINPNNINNAFSHITFFTGKG